MRFTDRTFVVLALWLVLFLFAPATFCVFALFLIVIACCADWYWARKPVSVDIDLSRWISRNGSHPYQADQRVAVDELQLRQPLPYHMALTPDRGVKSIVGRFVGFRRGRYELHPVVSRRRGPLGLVDVDRKASSSRELEVFPDVQNALRFASLVRSGKHSEIARVRGAYGIGTEFDHLREYVPGDDVRQVNWYATLRTGKPIVNQLRIETERDVHIVLDSGRLMTAPVDQIATRFDVALDAAVAVAYCADAMGDRVGGTVFDQEIVREVPNRRGNGERFTRSIYDCEPRMVESDYVRVFQSLQKQKRRLVMLFCDMADEAVAASLIRALPILARKHSLVVLTTLDPDLTELIDNEPMTTTAAYRTIVAERMLQSQQRAIHLIKSLGGKIVNVKPDQLTAAAVSAYLQAKASAR